MQNSLYGSRKAKHLDATTMFTYSHANTPLSQSERAYYLSYFINTFGLHNSHKKIIGFRSLILQPIFLY